MLLQNNWCSSAGYALAALVLGKCQLGSCPFCATGVPHCPVLPWEPSELSVWSSQPGSGCSGSRCWQSRLGQGPVETLTYIPAKFSGWLCRLSLSGKKEGWGLLELALLHPRLR